MINSIPPNNKFDNENENIIEINIDARHIKTSLKLLVK